MNIFVIGLIVLIIGATVGGLIEYLLGLVLPEKPQREHIIAITITIIALACFVVWVSSISSENSDIAPTPARVDVVENSEEEEPKPTETLPPIPSSTPTISSPTHTPPFEPTNTSPPKPTATIQFGYPTNNPEKWLLDIRETEPSYILDSKGTRNNLGAAREFQHVDREAVFNLFEESGRVTSAYENYHVDCNELRALVAFNQEIMTFSTKDGAHFAFEYFKNNPERVSFTSSYVNSEIWFSDEGSPGNQYFQITNPRSFYHCGESLEVFESIEIFQRENIIGIIITVGRDEANTQIPNHWYALDLDLNIIADQ